MWLLCKSGIVDQWKKKSESDPPLPWGCRSWDDYRRRSPEDLQEGDASLEARAGQFLEIGEQQRLQLVREITSHLNPSLRLVVDLGQMKGTGRPVYKRSGVQEVLPWKEYVQEIQVLFEASYAQCIFKVF